MPNYIRIADTDIYLRVFEQGEFAFIGGSASAHIAVDFDLERDFADARAVCGSDTLPAAKYYFTFEGQQSTVSNQAVWSSDGYPVIWGMWGDYGAENIYLALLRGGYNPKGSAMNYYLPVVTCDGELFYSTNQTTAYMPVSELTVYENNPNFVEGDEDNEHSSQISSKLISYVLRKAGVPMADIVAQMLYKNANGIPDKPVVTLTGDFNNLVYEFDQSTLSMTITDTGGDGDTITFVGDTLTLAPVITEIIPSATYELKLSNEARYCIISSNLHPDQMVEFYEDGRILFVEINNQFYELEPWENNGYYGYGNSAVVVIRDIDGNIEELDGENTGEPFAIVYGNNGYWYMYAVSSVDQCRLYGYVDGAVELKKYSPELSEDICPVCGYAAFIDGMYCSECGYSNV